MADFNIAIEKLLKHEGGYVNDPLDKGGETYKGISRKAHKNLNIWITIDKYKKDCGGVNSIFKKKLNSDKTIENEIINVYKTNYWDVFELDNLKSQKIAEQIFDDSVNRGIGAACKLCCSLLNLPISTKPSKELICELKKL